MKTHFKKTFAALTLVIVATCLFLFKGFYQEAKSIAITKLNEQQFIYANQASRGIEDFFTMWKKSLSSLAKIDAIISNNDTGKNSLKLFYETNQSEISAIARLDEKGVVIASFPDAGIIGKNLSEQKHISDLLKKQQPIVSDVFKAAEGFTAIAIHVPVFKNSEFKGSVGILIDFKNLAKRHLDLIRIGKTGHAWLISRDGTILYTLLPDATGKSVFEITSKNPSISNIVNDMLKGGKGAAEYVLETSDDQHLDSIKKYAVYQPVTLGNTFWSIAVVSAEDDALSYLSSFQEKLASVIGGLFVLGMLVSAFGAKAWLIVKEEAVRNQAEAKLRESQERFRQIAETAGEFIWEVNLDGLYTYASPSVERILGYTPAELVGKKYFYDFLTDSVYAEQKTAILQLLSKQQLFRDFPKHTVSRTGKIVELLSSGSPTLDVNGKVIGYRGVDMDISQYKLAEENFRLLVEASPYGVVLVDNQGKIKLVNAETARMFGYPREELIGKTIEYLLPERYRKGHMALRSTFSMYPESRTMGDGRELYALRKDGTEFMIEIGLRPIQTAEETLILAAITDITARKETERKLDQQRNQLNHLTRVNMLGTLSGALAHELNQPLTAILYNAQAALRFLRQPQPDLNEIQDTLKDIVADDKRAGDVMHRLRLLLKDGEIIREVFDVKEMLEGLLKLLKNSLIEHCADIEIEMADNLPAVNADKIGLQQVLINLLMNACDAMSELAITDRRLKISISLPDNNFILVSVSDNGRGIAEENLEKIFEPFHTYHTDGMGLGLSICDSIITAHGGKLWATNNPEHGATLQFTLPIKAR